MENCLFCKIIKGDVQSKKVYENEYVYAFYDIHPVAPVHILIIPKIHIESINCVDASNEVYVMECMKAIKEIAKMCGIAEEGYRVINNCGENGGQVIHHLHFHLLGGRHLGAKLIKE
ncbi:MAG: histidine triad nucleotide-binding protein [Clostridia bacterium]|nr:histidine triad nucleotide-binding protein [Clostridia bacterium]